MRGRTGSSASSGTVSRRALIEAEDFARGRAVAALQRGDSLALQDVPRRPNAALVAGLVVAVLITAATAATAYVSGRPPHDWRAERTLVLDRQTGARFVVASGTLRPAPTLTSAVLAGAGRKPVLVPHEQLRRVRVGAPLPSQGLPESPPTVPAHPRGLVACTAGTAAVDVYAGAPSTQPVRAQGLLVSPPGSTDVLLVTGRRASPIVNDAMLDLGYSPAQVRTVPRAWLALVPRGVRLAPLAVPPPDPAGPADPAGVADAVADAVAGVGAAGEVVTAQGSDERFLVQGGQVHPFLNATSALLAPAPARSVPPPALAAAPHGAPVGLLDAPTRPPVVPAREDVVTACVRSSDGLVTVVAGVADAGTRSGTARSTPTGGAPLAVTWHSRPGEGAVVGPAGVDVEPPPGSANGSGGAQLVADGVGYPVADAQAERTLGLTREQALPLPDAWLALAAPGPVLTVTR